MSSLLCLFCIRLERYCQKILSKVEGLEKNIKGGSVNPMISGIYVYCAIPLAEVVIIYCDYYYHRYWQIYYNLNWLLLRQQCFITKNVFKELIFCCAISQRESISPVDQLSKLCRLSYLKKWNYFNYYVSIIIPAKH